MQRGLMDVALGLKPADLLIKGGVLMDVYSGRMVPDRTLAVSGEKIVYVGPFAPRMAGPRTQVVDAAGRVMCPGYITAHTHLANYWNIADFLDVAIPGGLTTLVTEVESYGLAMGAEGVEIFLDQIKDRPINCYGLVPPQITRSQATKKLYINRERARRLLAHPNVMGLGEPYWQGVVWPSDDHMDWLLEEAEAAGKSVQGHAAGAKGGKLAAYALAGAESCHEGISPEDILERLEMGFYAMIRHGDIRQDLEIILPLLGSIDLRRLILVTDGSNPLMVREHGYLVDVVQEAVDLGVPPLEAVRMVSLNPAEHLGLDREIGGLAPGRLADVLLLPAPDKMAPDLVIARGKIVAEKGKMLQATPRRAYPPSVYETVQVPRVSPEDLIIPAPGAEQSLMARTMDVHPGGLVTREGHAEIKVQDGILPADPAQDLLKVVFLERVTGKGEKFVGFARGWHLAQGALATSLTWDASGVLAVGADDISLARAVNRVIELRGASVVCRGEEVLAEVPFSVAGYVSDLTLDQVAEGLMAFQAAAAGLGCSLENAHLTLNVASATAIPFIKLTEGGYYRFRENDLVGVFLAATTPRHRAKPLHCQLMPN